LVAFCEQSRVHPLIRDSMAEDFVDSCRVFGFPPPFRGSWNIDRSKEQVAHLIEKGPCVNTEATVKDCRHHERSRARDPGVAPLPGGNSTVFEAKRKAQSFGREPGHRAQVRQNLALQGVLPAEHAFEVKDSRRTVGLFGSFSNKDGCAAGVAREERYGSTSRRRSTKSFPESWSASPEYTPARKIPFPRLVSVAKVTTMRPAQWECGSLPETSSVRILASAAVLAQNTPPYGVVRGADV
jgi:hypothetical protein